MKNIDKKHIQIEGYTESLKYTAHKGGGGRNTVKFRNREEHGNIISQQLERIKEELNLSKEIELPLGVVRDDVIYVEFTSEWDHKLSFKSLDSNSANEEYKLLNIRKESQTIENALQERYHVTVMMKEGGVSTFLKKVEYYLNDEKDGKNGPRGNTLLNNINNIKRATLKSFWTDSLRFPFPIESEQVWWEAWFRKSDSLKIEQVISNLEFYDIGVSQTELTFAEHSVRLIYGSVEQLSESLLLLDNLAELRKPQEISDFISDSGVSSESIADWLEDLVDRVSSTIYTDSVLICLLDSGVNNQHPLLSPFLPTTNLYTYNSSWGTNDTGNGSGHGTLVAGLALYGDLVDVLSTSEEIEIFHGLESYKIYNHRIPNNPELYGSITEEACSAPLIMKPDNPRVFCMTVTSREGLFRGRPSTWSASLDKISLGITVEPQRPQLFIVSGGNTEIDVPEDYPLKNLTKSIDDPGQSYNAITVGSYTIKDRLRVNDWNLTPLAPLGAMSPSNSTSIEWDHQWPIKPDIVMEGGNSASNEEGIVDTPDDLSLLSTDKRFPNSVFSPFGDTSAAAPLAAKLAAELMTSYPNLWPESIRGLIIHSAEWTEEMKKGKDIKLGKDRKVLLRSVGYGVPNEKKAFKCANNSLTLIAERYIQPYIKLDKEEPKTNEYHLFELPWPKDVLANELYNKNITITVTLSYFIEPNPGSKKYSSKYHYQSHDLDFMVIKAEETLDVFKQRVSAASESTSEKIDRTSEPWTLKTVRSRGSIKKDYYTTTGADMAVRNIIAVFPKNGWYKIKKRLNRFNSEVRYSLIISLDTLETNIDIYTPVLIDVENIISV